MAEDVLVGPAGDIQPRPCWKKSETGLREFHPPFAVQTFDEHVVQPVEKAHVRRGILALRIVEGGRAPVARLLLLGDVFVEQLVDQVLQTMAVGVGARQLAGDLGAEHRRGDHAEVIIDRGEIEAGEVIDLEPRGIGQHRLQVGRVVAAAAGEAHQVLVPPPVGYLHDAEAVARRDQPHGLGIDGDGPRREHAVGQVFLMKMNSH